MAGMTPDNGWLAFVLLARAAARSQWSFAMAAVATTFEDETIASSEEHDSQQCTAPCSTIVKGIYLTSTDSGTGYSWIELEESYPVMGLTSLEVK